MDNRKALNFLKYINTPMSRESIIVLYNANNINIEKCELYNEIIQSLIFLVYDTYMGDDITNEKESFSQRKRNVVNLSQAITSGSTTLLVVILVAILYRGESNSYYGNENVNLVDQNSRTYFKELQFKVINTPLNDPSYKLFAASRLIQSGFVSEGLGEVNKIYLQDPRNLDTLMLLALTYERINNLPKAIVYREKIAQLDPWNASNFLALGKDYKLQGDFVKSEAMLEKILSFASTNSIAKQASEELNS
jgi:tetratricopeptide (TPR) repeat protein